MSIVKSLFLDGGAIMKLERARGEIIELCAARKLREEARDALDFVAGLLLSLCGPVGVVCIVEGITDAESITAAPSWITYSSGRDALTCALCKSALERVRACELGDGVAAFLEKHGRCKP